MAASNLCGTNGKIPGRALDFTTAPLSNLVTNPLSSNLSAATIHSITDCAKVSTSILETDQLKTVQGSLVLKVQVGSDLEFQDGNELFYNGDAVIRSSGDFVLDTLPVAPSAFPTVIGYDTTTGKCYSQNAGGGGGGTVTSVVAGTGISVNSTNPAAPVVSATGVQSVNAGGNISVTGTSTDPVINLAISGNVNMNAYQLQNSGNISFNQDTGDARLDGCKEVKAYGGASLNLNCDGGGSILFTTNANQRGSCDLAGNWSFGSFPSVSGTPTSGNQLSNKTYVDTKVASVASSGSYITVGGTATAPTVALNYTPTTRMFYVSPQGNDITGNGTALLPYATIQTAVTAAEAVASSANPCLVSVALGNYTESITFGKGYVGLIGTVSSYNSYAAMPRITGTITVNLTGSNDLFGRQVSLENFIIIGGVTDTTASTQHTLSLKNLYISSTATRGLNVAAGPTDGRTYVRNCFFNNTANLPAIAIATGWLIATFNEVTQSGTAEALNVSGTATVIQSLGNTFQSTHTSSNPVVVITSTTTTPHTFSNCAFLYTSATGKVAGTSTGILIPQLTGTVCAVSYCIFSLLGITDPTGHAILTTGGVGTPVVVYAANYNNGVNAIKVGPNITAVGAAAMS